MPFEQLRSLLAALPPTGDQGFEGLVAAAFCEISGETFRLVGSGRQFGRDGESVVRGAAIMMEAKRYSDRLRYEALSLKLHEALERSGRAVEVWCAAATVPFEAVDSGDLEALGERHGVTVLVLDWAPPMPPLAVLLATARAATIEWFSRNAPGAQSDVERELAVVASHELFGCRGERIRAELRTQSLGLALARRQNAAWLELHFSDVHLALHRFNQPLAPLDRTVRPPLFERVRLEERVRAAIATWTPDSPLVVLTGLPGTGSDSVERLRSSSP